MRKTRTPPDHTRQQLFSSQLQTWLKTGKDKTLFGLTQLFGDKSFAIIFLLLMALPALPIPTGGVTHVTEIITMLICLELIAGRKTIWLPKRWSDINVSKVLAGKAAQRLLAVIMWFERHSRRRGSGMLAKTAVLSVVGVIILILTVVAFVAPPFSGLDTLPALGVVTMSLALILEDVLILLVGIIIGAIGIGIEITAGAALYSGIRHLF